MFNKSIMSSKSVTQSELALEESLISQLEGMEYARVRIDDEAAMLAIVAGNACARLLEIRNFKKHSIAG